MSGSRVLLLACIGCGSVTGREVADAPPSGVDAAVAGGDAQSVGCGPLGAFSAPMPLTGFDTSANEGVARLSPDELTMYFSGLIGNAANADIYVATRASRDQSFGMPAHSPVSSTTGNEFDPTLSADQLLLVFSSDRDGPTRIYAATRANKIVDFTASAPVSGVAAADATVSDGQPFLTADGQELWFTSTRPGGLGGLDVWRATLASGSFSSPALVPGLSSASSDASPVVSSDKLTVYFSSDRPGGASAGLHIWRAYRKTLQDPFTTLEPVPELTLGSSERAGWLSPDNCRLYMTSGASGNNNIYLATRTK